MLPPNFRQHFWVTTKKRNCHQIKINFIEWTSADTIIISSNCLKLTKSFEYYQVDSFGIFTCDLLYVQYFVWLNHVPRYIYVYRSFKWWIFFHQFTFCAIIPSHQIVGTYQYKRTCMSTFISGESLHPEICRIDCNHPSRWSVGVFISLMKDIHL